MDFGMCAKNMTEDAITPDIVFDLIECQSAEMSYRIITFGISLITPMFQVIYDALDYPADGYYGGGLLDGIQHVQAKPLECAFATTLMAFNAPQWLVHVFADVGKQLIKMLQDIRGAVSITPMSDMIDEFTDAIFEFNTEAIITVMRTMVISFRDLLIGILELARAISTMVHFKQSDEKDRDPRTPSDKFHDSQKLIVNIIALIQNFAKLFTRTFVEGIASLLRCMMLLARALYSTKNKADLMKEFFQAFMNSLAKSLTPMMANLGKMLLHKDSPFFPICTGLELLKKGVCTMVQDSWIPNGVNIKCGNKKTCSWWGFNDKPRQEYDKTIYHENGQELQYLPKSLFPDAVDFSGVSTEGLSRIGSPGPVKRSTGEVPGEFPGVIQRMNPMPGRRGTLGPRDVFEFDKHLFPRFSDVRRATSLHGGSAFLCSASLSVLNLGEAECAAALGTVM
jgi:hypothetical protein